ncbi:MAG: hypothetical protein P4L41_10255 [Flavipsychrobacter sp.]|nr:hypothetical protein [Flavipsychrobacter sp.]
METSFYSIKKIGGLITVLLVMGISSMAQTTYLPLSDEDYHMLDRLETRSGRFSDTLCLTTKPESRKRVVQFLQNLSSVPGTYSAVDSVNMARMVSKNGEWTPDGNGADDSKQAWFNTFYKKQDDFIYVKTDNFFLVVNPVLGGQGMVQNANITGTTIGKNPLLYNTHGFEWRGWICKKIGFYTYFTDNQETPPTFVNNYVVGKPQQAVPGADYYLISNKSPSYDYFLASGYFDFAIIKDHMNMTFGTGKHFIGDGIYSLELSDMSANTPFLQLTTRIWKINYQNLYMQLTPQYDRFVLDSQLPHKYATMHYLSYNATNWLNVGFFESTIFATPNTFQISYLNPIILYKTVEQFNGNPDKELIGFNYKAIVARHLQFYGQFILNEFKASHFFSNGGWYDNKWGLQLGAKYFDAFTVKNLDLQAELNMVRPYTYEAQHDTIANYTNYNQPLADPLGSGFIQFTGVANYQPIKNLYLTVKGMYYVQGTDTGSANYGNDIFKSFNNATTTKGVGMINGPKSIGTIINLNLSYELRRNMFIDLGASYRTYSSSAGVYPSYSTTGYALSANATTYMYIGIRLNAPRRNYDFF